MYEVRTKKIYAPIYKAPLFPLFLCLDDKTIMSAS
jgi:hypothetical protein